VSKKVVGVRFSNCAASYETMIAKFVSPVKRKDVLVRINELKVIEYYSR
jgi:hypothetical protein